MKGTAKERYAIAVLVLLVGVLCALLGFSLLQSAPPCAGCNAHVDFVLSPGAEGEVVSFIRSARRTIDVEMYVFTSEDIVRELGDAAKRGVRVRVILEPRVSDSRKQKVFDELSALGAEVRWASLEYKLTHAKMLIADGKRALLGSINFSESALNYNREADAIIEGEGVAELQDAFNQDWMKAAGAG